ncbi:MAG: hypothetical protein PQJ49_13760 [Sphaerochaetaceae bacterium]|nr:hypothetical protein [Sphaerochaetaceae bacterium]
MGYSTEFKQKFISEFLEIYKEDPNTSLRIFGLNKFGQNKSCIYDGLEKYDVNHVYQYKKKTHKSYKQAKNKFI